MERQKKRKVVVIIALLLIIMGISVAFALMSETLSIEGSAKISGWNIHFDNLDEDHDGAIETSAPIMSTDKLTISDYEVTITKPGDKAVYTFDVVNDGSIDAELNTLLKPTPTFIGAGSSASDDVALVSSNLVYTLTYSDSTPVAQGDTLTAKTTREMVLTIEYPSSVTELPLDDVHITDMFIELTYQQY